MSQLRGTVLIMTVLIALFLCIQFFSVRHLSWAGFDLRVHLVPSLTGGTRLVIPPVGSVTAATHPIPVRMEISLREVELEALSGVLDGAASGTLFVNLGHQLGRRAGFYVLSLMIITGALAPVLALAAGLRRRRHLVIAFAGGVVAVAILASVVYATYDVSAFEAHALDGPVSAFPDAWQVLQGGMDQLDDLRRGMRLMGANLMRLYDQWGETGGPGSFGREEFSLLVISDVHNNVPALDFVRGIIDAYPVRAVVDLGDLTDWGTPVEARIVDHIERLRIPYIFVPGNHESPLVVREMEELDNVVVLDGLHVVQDVVLAGFADPSALRDAPGEASEEELADLRRRYREAVREANALHPRSFLVLAAHHPGSVRGLGTMPAVRAVLTGHTHRPGVTEDEGTLHLDPGTTGASGVRGFMTDREVPHTALLLHFSRAGGEVQLVAVDSVSLSADRETATLRREISRSLSP